MKDRTYTIGRRGELRLEGRTVSNRHAELQVLNDEFYLTDLCSTNGTFLLQGGKKIPFKEGYVGMDQLILFGQCLRTVRELLELVDDHQPR